MASTLHVLPAAIRGAPRHGVRGDSSRRPLAQMEPGRRGGIGDDEAATPEQTVRRTPMVPLPVIRHDEDLVTRTAAGRGHGGRTTLIRRR